MSVHLAPRIKIAQTPTPLQFLRGPSARFQAPVLAKRDDTTGSVLSGNKARKLEFLLADALRRGAKRVVTCGGVNSNHARATAVAAAELGLERHLVLRGMENKPPTGNLLLDRYVGAEITFISPEAWSQRAEIMQAIAGADGYIIPEGGSNALGSLGYVVAAEELLAQETALGKRIGRVVHATGSAGTTAGLALGFAAAGRTDIDVIGFAVCNDAPYFNARIECLLEDAVRLNLTCASTIGRARWRIYEDFIGPGYARTTPEALETLSRLARAEGLVLDPVYTGKAFQGLMWLMEQERDSRVTIFIHTGGMFELFAYSRELDDAMVRSAIETNHPDRPRSRVTASS